MLIPKHLKAFARTRNELVFAQGSPLTQKYTALSCENCEAICEEAVVTSVGLSWRSGWLLLCKKCYKTLNFWEETDEQQSKSIERNLVKVLV
jgi:hypothetical protein